MVSRIRLRPHGLFVFDAHQEIRWNRSELPMLVLRTRYGRSSSRFGSRSKESSPARVFPSVASRPFRRPPFPPRPLRLDKAYCRESPPAMSPRNGGGVSISGAEAPAEGSDQRGGEIRGVERPRTTGIDGEAPTKAKLSASRRRGTRKEPPEGTGNSPGPIAKNGEAESPGAEREVPKPPTVRWR
jgi:hypothetical protein